MRNNHSAVNVNQEIKRFNQDDAGEWIAELACGHARHVRHNPPWHNYPWILTSAGRDEMIGAQINCGICDKQWASGSRLQTPGKTKS